MCLAHILASTNNLYPNSAGLKSVMLLHLKHANAIKKAPLNVPRFCVLLLSVLDDHQPAFLCWYCERATEVILSFASWGTIVRQLGDIRSPTGGHLFTNWRTISLSA